MGQHSIFNHITYTKPEDSSTYLDFQCGHCNRDVSGIIVAVYHYVNDDTKWIICPSCKKGSVYGEYGIIFPACPYGFKVEGLPELVELAYKEARDCFSQNAYISCEHICRKILMYIAVDKGAEENKSFSHYIEYIQSKGFITEPMNPWVTLIKDHGNKAAHVIEKPDKKRAESTLMFTAELLKIIYEMEYMANKYKPVKKP
jgi:hypothetical protein